MTSPRGHSLSCHAWVLLACYCQEQTCCCKQTTSGQLYDTIACFSSCLPGTRQSHTMAPVILCACTCFKDQCLAVPASLSRAGHHIPQLVLVCQEHGEGMQGCQDLHLLYTCFSAVFCCACCGIEFPLQPLHQEPIPCKLLQCTSLQHFSSMPFHAKRLSAVA